jgi:hypothetical protein
VLGGDVVRTRAHGGGEPDVTRPADRDLLDLQRRLHVLLPCTLAAEVDGLT